MLVKRLAVAMSLAAFAVAGLAVGPVAAYSIVSETGMVGHWSFDDSVGTPGATCGYSQQYPPNSAFFRWMKVKPPTVYAADRDSNKVDHKTVKWFWKLQSSHYANTWKTVATSDTQTRTAYDNQAAPFTALRIDHNVGQPYNSDVYFRALVIIKWIKGDGSVEGTAKATIDYYKAKTPWNQFVFGNPWCPAWITSG